MNNIELYLEVLTKSRDLHVLSLNLNSFLKTNKNTHQRYPNLIFTNYRGKRVGKSKPLSMKIKTAAKRPENELLKYSLLNILYIYILVTIICKKDMLFDAHTIYTKTRTRADTRQSERPILRVEVYDTHHAYIIIHLYVRVCIDNSVDESHDLRVLNFIIYILMYILLVYFMYI